MAEQIADTIAREITHGRLAAGQKLSEVELANRFGVSRGPVRDALDLLERNMLVAIKPRSHTRVNRLTVRELDQLFTFRRQVLAIAAQFAARNRSAKDIIELSLGLERVNNSMTTQSQNFSMQTYIATQMWDMIIAASHSHIVRQACMHFTGGNIWSLAIQDRLVQDKVAAHGQIRFTLWQSVCEAIENQDETVAYQAGETLVANNWDFLKHMFQQCFPEN